jgi:CRISPR system Cascade subunit CasA
VNLLSSWIPVIRQDGTQVSIAPWQIVETDNPVVELNAPRPNFQGALYQFLIGLLQTCMAPEDMEEWGALYHSPPEPSSLKQNLNKLTAVFELFGGTEQPAFMQDLELNDGEEKGISGLLIEAPGGKTLKDNLDFFIKGRQINGMCPSCTAQALFTLQINAPAGGVGHRVGLRGGGPLTTLIQPVGKSTLWQKLWLNVLDQEEGLNPPANIADASIFPWMGPTRASDKTGQNTIPGDTHPLQMYWAMPRRIRLVEATKSGCCDLCGESRGRFYSHYLTRNYGTNYEGPWIHPLTPYRFDAKNEKPPLSLKGQKGGLSYRHWLGLMFQDQDNGDRAARVVNHFYQEKEAYLDTEKQLNLWCFGYDMDNMKARCWYEHALPIFHLQPKQILNVQAWIQELLAGAKDTAPLLRKYIKEAWYRRPEDAKGDISFVDTEFWQATETQFYTLIAELAALPSDTSLPPPEIYDSWYGTLYKTIERLFSQFALQTTVEDLDLKRVIQARKNLFEKFNALKPIKTLKDKGQVTQEVANG